MADETVVAHFKASWYSLRGTDEITRNLSA